MRKTLRPLGVLSLVAAATLLASPAQAADANADFSQHVTTCAQTMGFDGDHNPGMHQGKSGWHEMHGGTMG